MNMSLHAFTFNNIYFKLILCKTNGLSLKELAEADIRIGYYYSSVDAKGNIKTIIENGLQIIYYYNELDELIQEDNQVLNKTIVYSYDVGGNLKSKLEINIRYRQCKNNYCL